MRACIAPHRQHVGPDHTSSRLEPVSPRNSVSLLLNLRTVPACENSAVPLSWSIRMFLTNVVSGSNRNQGGLTIKTNSSCAGLYSSSMVTDTAHTMRGFVRQRPTVRLSIGQPVGGAVDNELENANTRSRVSLSFFASDTRLPVVAGLSCCLPFLVWHPAATFLTERCRKHWYFTAARTCPLFIGHFYVVCRANLALLAFGIIFLMKSKVAWLGCRATK